MNCSGEYLSSQGIYGSQQKHFNLSIGAWRTVRWNEHHGGLAVKRKWKIKWKENRCAKKHIKYPVLVNDHALYLPVGNAGVFSNREDCDLRLLRSIEKMTFLFFSDLKYCVFNLMENQAVRSLLKLLPHPTFQSLSSCYY